MPSPVSLDLGICDKASPNAMNATPNRSTNAIPGNQLDTLTVPSEFIAALIDRQNHQPGVHLPMTIITLGIRSTGNAMPEVNMMTRPYTLAIALIAALLTAIMLTMKPLAAAVRL